MRYIIDPEFKTLIFPMQEQEYRQLEKNIRTEGCREPIIVWNNTIIDGHNRYEICVQNHIPFKTVTMHFACRKEAIIWICSNQLGRRNISNETRKYLIGVQYDAEKEIQSTRFSDPDNESHEISIVSSSPLRTSERIARENNITHGTVEKYAVFSRAVSEIGRKCPEMERRILAGGYKLSHDNVILLAKKAKEDLIRLNEQLSRSEAAYVRYAEARAKMSESTLPAVTPQKGASIKDMPKFDPDAELTGLTLTIPSWISSLERIKNKADFVAATSDAKGKLYSRLENLRDTAVEVMNMCEGK